MTTNSDDRLHKCFKNTCVKLALFLSIFVIIRITFYIMTFWNHIPDSAMPSSSVVKMEKKMEKWWLLERVFENVLLSIINTWHSMLLVILKKKDIQILNTCFSHTGKLKQRTNSFFQSDFFSQGSHFLEWMDWTFYPKIDSDSFKEDTF